MVSKSSRSLRSTPRRSSVSSATRLLGLLPYKARDAALTLGFPTALIRPASALIAKAYQLFTDKDCSLVEINPLIETDDGNIIALDAKVSIEDDAMFRHPELRGLHDPNQMDPLEQEASEYDLAYVKLEGGRVGCMVNGAGLAMATMDITKWAGAEPANFLDIGGSADLDRIEHAFKIIVSDPDVEIILVNLFAGIARSDVVATGIINAARELGSDKPSSPPCEAPMPKKASACSTNPTWTSHRRPIWPAQPKSSETN